MKFCRRKPNTWRHIFAVVVYVLPSKFSYTTAFFCCWSFFQIQRAEYVSVFQSILNDGVFPDDGEKSNIVQCHKKDSKNLIKNYWPISLLPIFSKVLERLIYNSLYNYFIQNKLFTECQSGFMPCDSCVAQLLSITHEIYNSFDYNPSVDIRGVFLDIS